jgi:hypothetical protein
MKDSSKSNPKTPYGMSLREARELAQKGPGTYLYLARKAKKAGQFKSPQRPSKGSPRVDT